MMDKIFDFKRELPYGQLYRIFKSAGWAEAPQTDDMLINFNMLFAIQL
jgi:hypothetical protein